MSRTSFLIGLLLASSFAWAQAGKAHSHDSHQAKPHNHGAGRLDFSYEKGQGEIELEVSADAILGSEKSPKTETERQAEKEKLKLFEKQVQDSLQISGADCKWTQSEVKVDRHRHGKSEHADVEMEAKFTCTQDLKAKALKLGLFQHYPKLEKIEAQILTTEQQRGHIFDPKNQEFQF